MGREKSNFERKTCFYHACLEELEKRATLKGKPIFSC